MVTVYQEVEVEVDLADFDTDDLLEELDSRDVAYRGGNEVIIRDMYNAYTKGQDTEPFLRELFHNALGRIV